MSELFPSTAAKLRTFKPKFECQRDLLGGGEGHRPEESEVEIHGCRPVFPRGQRGIIRRRMSKVCFRLSITFSFLLHLVKQGMGRLPLQRVI